MDLMRRALAFQRRRPRAVSAQPFLPGVRPMPAEPRPASIEVLLCEREVGGLVLVDATRGGQAAGLLRLGRARLAPHHLSAPARLRLQHDGLVQVEGADACNALLAFGGAPAGG